jgi:hypothetical protein
MTIENKLGKFQHLRNKSPGDTIAIHQLGNGKEYVELVRKGRQSVRVKRKDSNEEFMVEIHEIVIEDIPNSNQI